MGLQLNAKNDGEYVVETPDFTFFDVYLHRMNKKKLTGKLLVNNTDTDETIEFKLRDEQHIEIIDGVYVSLKRRTNSQHLCLDFVAEKSAYPIYRFEVFLREINSV